MPSEDEKYYANRGQSYACRECAESFEETESRLVMAKTACQEVAVNLRRRRDDAAQFHILVLDSSRCSDGTKPPIAEMINKENLLLMKLMKTVVVLSMLNDRYGFALNEMQTALIRRISCIHRIMKL